MLECVRLVTSACIILVLLRLSKRFMFCLATELAFDGMWQLRLAYLRCKLAQGYNLHAIGSHISRTRAQCS